MTNRITEALPPPLPSVQRYSTKTRPADDDDFWYEGDKNGAVANSGSVVTVDSAMQTAAVIACVKLISESIACLPLQLYDYDPKTNSRTQNKTDELWYTLHYRPNNYMTSFEWRELLGYNLCLRGNFYNLILNGKYGAYSQFIPLVTDNVTVIITDDYQLQYKYSKPNGGTETYRQDQILHIKGLSNNGIVGITPIEMYKQIVGSTLASELYAARFFRNDARPGGVLEHPGTLGEEAAKTLKRTWMAQHSGASSAHTIAVLEEGMTFKPTSMTNSDAQFLESRRYQVNDIARIFRVPPHMIGDLERSTNNNIEQQSLEFVCYTLQPWLTRIEQAVNTSLFNRDPTKFIKFNADAFLRGDTFTRFRAHAIALQNGFKNVNEVRETEDMNPIPGGEVFQQFKVGNSGSGTGGSDRGNYDRSNSPSPSNDNKDKEND